MDGLECCEIMLNHLEYSKRIDAEHYQKLYLNYEKAIKYIPHDSLCQIANFLIGPFGSSYDTDDYVDNSPYRYIRGQDVKPFVLKDTDPKFIAENDYIRLARYALQEKDIMVSVVGTLGNACIIRKKDIPAIFSCKSTVVRVKTVAPEYLITYLNCKYGQQLLLRKERGAIQKGLNLDDLKSLQVPIFSSNFERLIADVLSHADIALDSSKLHYSQAQQLLLSQFGMIDNISSDEAISIKSFSSSFAKTGRLDAEYYQQKYDDLFRTISKCKAKNLGGNIGLVNIKKSIEPGSDAYCEEGIPFIRVSDITKFGITEPNIKLSPEVAPDISSLYPSKDTILLSKDGSVGIAYKVERNLKVVTSGALLHLKVKDQNEILPDYLTLVLNSPIVQLQAERDASGAIIQHWKPSEIEKVVIPMLDIPVQKQIAKTVRESFTLRHQSEQMLENAKHAVEIAIEQGEDKAIDWLKEREVEG